jgi:lipopolysaccharide biosynthesis glycosyltransferase
MIPVVFTIDRKFLPPAYIAINSMISSANVDTSYDIIVLYQGRIDGKVSTLYNLVENTHHKMIIKDVREYSINAPVVSNVWPSIV